MWLSSLTEQQRHAALRLAHNVVVSDGILDPNEEGMLDEFRREMELLDGTELEYLELDGIEEVFADRRSRMIVLLNLCKLSYADGAFEIEEECLLREISKAFAFSDDDFRLVDNWVKRICALEQEAKVMMESAI
ncbi:MAG: TerB family tellurite resistance protein [Pseudomonadales bacterium]|jgi:tellurite resistance protein|nr:TerB family tellurite resistance protein [Pseudomonadales bacterium]